MCVCEAELLIEQGLQFQIHHDSLHLWQEERKSECVYRYLGENKSLVNLVAVVVINPITY